MSLLGDDNLIAEFVIEGREHLSSIEPDLLSLEKHGANVEQEVINRIFRAIHSIKGAAGFFGFEGLKNLSHIMESLLMKIRDGQIVPSHGIIDNLLIGVDKLRLMIDDIQASDNVECAGLIACLEDYVNGKTPEAEPAAATPVASIQDAPAAASAEISDYHFDVSQINLEPEIKQGRWIFELTIDVQQDLVLRNRSVKEFTTLLNSMGKVIATYPENLQDNPEAATGLSTICFLYATVLEQELLPPAMHLPTGAFNLLPINPKAKGKQQVAEAAPAQEAEQPQKPEPATAQPTKSVTPAPSDQKTSMEAMETVRVKTDLLNRLMNLAGEMVLLRNQLNRTLDSHTGEIDGLPAIMQNLDLTTTDLQEHIMQTRMQPIGNVFGKFPRMVRDIARQLSKEIDIELIGEDVELDKTLLEALSDPLNHLVRNSCDHGIETSEVRERIGKPRKGTITLKAYHEGGQINIAISDDGKGIDAHKVAQKAVAKGLMTQADIDRMPAKDLVNLIFLPGLSTAEAVSDLSGRGVGMDVVRTNIEKLGGHITVESEPGMGTVILLRLPLTLAIIPSLIVGVQNHRFAISQINLVELICVKANDLSRKIETVNGAPVLRLRGKLLPLVRLADVLNIDRKFQDPNTGEVRTDRRQRIDDERQEVAKDFTVAKVPERRQDTVSDYYISVVQVGSNQYGLIVDNVLDLEEIVVKPLSTYLKHCQCFSGATIMGDGKVAMILDVGGIANYAKLDFVETKNEEYSREKQAQMAGDNTTTMDLILFTNALDELFAIPLASVLRLEKFAMSDIDAIGRQEYLTYRGKGLPLIRLDSVLPVKSIPADHNDAYMIIPKHGNGAAGIIASNILDVLSVEVSLQEIFGGRYKSVKGASIIKGRLTTLIDPEGLLSESGVQQLGSSTGMAFAAMN